MTVGIRLTGASGEYISTPDHADLDIAGDMCLVAHVALDDWTPTANQGLIGKFGASSGAYALRVDAATGYLEFVIDYGPVAGYTSTVIPTVDDGSALWVSATFDQDNGSSSSIVKFWTSSDGVAWSQLGLEDSSPSRTILNSSNPLTIGGWNLGVSAPMTGTIYSAQVFDGIGDNTAPGLGTLVAEYVAEESGTRYRDQTGKVWTCVGSSWATTNDE